MKSLAIILLVCGVVLIACGLACFSPASQNHASLESISLDYLEARTETLVGGIMVIAGLYLYKTQR